MGCGVGRMVRRAESKQNAIRECHLREFISGDTRVTRSLQGWVMSLLLLLIYFNDLSCIGDTLWYDDDATLISGGPQRDQDRMGCPADGCQKCLKSKKVMTESTSSPVP